MLRNRRDTSRRSAVVKPSAQSVPPSPPNFTSSRIPALLQAVFLSSNRGNVVNEPPHNRLANMVFFGKKLRTPWSKTKKQEDSLGVERNESSTSSNDDTIPTTISASSSSSSFSPPTKYFQDFVVYPSALPPVTKAPLKVGAPILYQRNSIEDISHPNTNFPLHSSPSKTK
jgi:hypothetical protein